MNNRDDLFSPSSTTSTVRPRNRRLISLDDDNEFEPVSTAAASSSSFSVSAATNTSRGVSPIPATHLSRKQPDDGGAKAASSYTREGGRSPSNNRINGSGASSGLWESWSSLQGLASTLLGSDAQSFSKSKPNGSLKVPAWKKTNIVPEPSRCVSEWGPNIEATPRLAAGTQEERHAMVQAKKREALLLASAQAQTDKTGRFKRRDSDANIAAPAAHDEDALVYVHKVGPADTLAGVMIKYNCQQAVFRKVNRFWPNDNIHIRTHVFLPLEACSVRGQKLEDGQEIFDLLGSDDHSSVVTNTTSLDSPPTPFDVHQSSHPLSLSLALTSSHDTCSFRHESWVRIPNIAEPVEILRIPRRTLGFFPPARRKSNTFSDTSEHGDGLHSENTPKSSFDMLRHPPTHAASQNASPARRPLHTRAHRSSSTTSTTKAVTFADRLKGPGGVGSLRGSNMSTPVPGPAEDPLNKMFAHHLPSVAPPGLTPKATPRATPRVSADSIRSNSSTGLGEVGGAIEGWVRKLGGKTGTKSEGFRERMGDLIELEGTGARDEGGALVADGDADGGETPAPTMNAHDEALLRDRFPPRGRIRDAYPGKGKGKAD
jgi:hypothetical protein